MKKTLKMVLCLALAVLMLSSVAFASQADGKPEVAGTGVTLAADNTLTVNVAAADVTEDAQYVILVVKANGTDAMTTAQAILDGAKVTPNPTVTYDVGENTIYYIDQSAATASGLAFTGKPKEGLVDSLIILGGGTDPVVVGAIKTFGSTVNAKVEVKGATDADKTATKVQLDSNAAVATTTADGKQVATFSGVSAGAHTLTATSGTKYVAREYAITAPVDGGNVDMVIQPLGDTTGDGVVNLGDYRQILQHVKKAAGATLTDYTLKCAETTGDSVVNLGDYRKVLQHVKKVAGANLW